jgi:hypothetical protein
VNVGEFGLKVEVFQRAESAVFDYLTDIHQVMDLYSIHRQYWAFRGDMGLHNTFAGFLPVVRMRNETFHTFLAGLKQNRARMRKPEDRDADGMADIWERSHFGGTGSVDGSGDSDRDGTADLVEYLAGTHPGDSSSSFRILSQTHAGGVFTLEWSAIPWRAYTIERATSLTLDNFVPIATRHVATKSVERSTDPSPPSGPHAFYRVRVSD